MRFVLVLAVVACGKSSQPPNPDPGVSLRDRRGIMDAIERGTLAGPGLSVAGTPRAAPTTPGPAYLAVRNMAGIVKVDQGTATRIAVPVTYANAVAVGDKGDVYVAGDKQLFKVTGGTVEKVGALAPEHLSSLAVAPDQTVWGRSLQKIYRFDNGTWRAAEVAVQNPQDIGFDGAGHVFVYGTNGMFVFDGSWKTMLDFGPVSEEHKSETPCLSIPAVSPTGELWIAACDYLLQVTKGKAAFHLVDGSGFVGGRFLGATYYAMTSPQQGLGQLSVDGATMTKIVASGVRSTFPRTIDGRGRLWSYDSKVGLEVLTPDGKAMVYKAGAISEINGDIADFAIAGTGPDVLPSPAGEAARGTISGKVVTSGVPAADAKVELCGDPDSSFKTTPCDGKPDRVTGKTDKDGVFAIEAVLRSYRVTVQVGGQWFAPPLLHKGCVDLKPGDVCFIGEMDTARAY